MTLETPAETTDTTKPIGGKSASFAPVSKAWSGFVKKLIAVLRGRDAGDIVSLQSKSNGEWIQIAVQKSNFRIECKSDAFREDHELLTPKQRATVADIGWMAPTGSAEESTPAKDFDGSPNHFVDLPTPLRQKDLNELVGRTFVEVFDTARPEALDYEAFGADGDSLFLPELALKPEITCTDASQNPKLPEQLLAAITELTGVGGWSFDDQHDIGPIGFGSIRAYARVVEQSPYVRFYVPAVDDVEETPELLSKLNEINTVHGHLHVCLMNSCVTLVSDVLVSPFNKKYVAAGLANFLQVAEQFSIELQQEFGTSKAPAQKPLWH